MYLKMFQWSFKKKVLQVTFSHYFVLIHYERDWPLVNLASYYSQSRFFWSVSIPLKSQDVDIAWS